MVKISILLLYRRIFNTSAFRKMSLAVGAACVGWAIAAILCLIFQCNPISGLWNPAYTFTDKCINLQAYYRGISGAHMGLDIILLAMPIYMVWNLRLDASQKLIVSGIFMLGSL